MWEPLAIEACYYVPVTSMISGAIVGSAAQYMWHLQRAIRDRMSGFFFPFSIVLLKSPIFIVALNYLFTVLQTLNSFLRSTGPLYMIVYAFKMIIKKLN